LNLFIANAELFNVLRNAFNTVDGTNKTLKNKRREFGKQPTNFVIPDDGNNVRMIGTIIFEYTDASNRLLKEEPHKVDSMVTRLPESFSL
jgi:hypothetical protein